MFRFILISLLALFLTACATGTKVVSHTETKQIQLPDHTKFVTQTETTRFLGLSESSYLSQGRLDFTNGYYKRAMHELLPLAVGGNPEAQYAVGYMFYYGYGVTQDTEIGCFWINRSAGQHFPPAMAALSLVN